MKITPKITELLFEISEIEDSRNVPYLQSGSVDLHNNLLKLYRVTDKKVSREKIIAIMDEAGFSWFSKLKFCDYDDDATLEDCAPDEILLEAFSEASSDDDFMSVEDFLDLLPANSYFH